MRFTEILSEQAPALEIEIEGGPFGNEWVVVGNESSVTLRSSLVHQLSIHSPTLNFFGTELYTVPGGTISDRVTGRFHYYGLPVGVGSTFTGKGSSVLTGGSGKYEGAWGVGSFEEAGVVTSVAPFEEADSGTATWNLHLP